MTYEQTIEYLDSLQPSTMRLELGPLHEACHLLGNPQDAFPSLHVAGTNGKGSTCAFLSTILEFSGYRVGLFTSPHLVDVRERIQINREPISKEVFSRIVTKIREGLPDDRMLTYFEMLTLVAFLFFHEARVDIAVIETGLGGRLDATNILKPKVAVITPVSLDHQQHLGRTLKEIATEKCGIIKRGIPTVVSYQLPEVMEVVRRTCDDVGSPLILATPEEVDGPLGLLGEHQRQNAACAVEAAQTLSQVGLHIERVEEALAATRWPGRLEVISTWPRVILDGAHNLSGAESLASYVREQIGREHAVLIIGVLADKDVAGMLRELAPHFREVICTRAPSHRAASPKDIAAAARSSALKVSIEEDVEQAIRKAKAKLSREDTLVIAGSLTIVGKAKALLSK